MNFPQQTIFAPLGIAKQTQNNKKLYFKGGLPEFVQYINKLINNINYVQCTTSNVSGFSQTYKFNDLDLLNLHHNNSVLLVDKYVLTAIPDPQLEYLLERQNITDFNAELSIDQQFNHKICTFNDTYSEIFTPNIIAEKYNPYKRWLSCVNSGNKTCNNLIDLAGLECTNELSPNNKSLVFLDVVCTFPYEVDLFLISPAARGSIIKRMHKCERAFFDELHNFLGVPRGNSLGLSSSLHVWSSTCPVLPNGHIHNLLPFFSYSYKEPVMEFCELWVNPKYKLPGGIRKRDIPIKYPEDCKQKYIERFNHFITPVLNGERIKTIKKTYGDGTTIKHNSHIIRIEKFIDEAFINDFLAVKYDLSLDMATYFNCKSCTWDNDRYPVNSDKVRELWSDIVYNEFGRDIMDHWARLDVHISFIPSTNKSKLLHALQYKVRPPVLDLNLFFNKCDNFITYYDSLDFNRVLNWLYYQLEISIRCSNYSDICKYEYLIKKAKAVDELYNSEDLFNWLEFLTTHKTNTRVYGFWNQFKTLQLDPDNTLFPHNDTCPICDGSISKLAAVPAASIDMIVVKDRSRFMVFDLDGG